MLSPQENRKRSEYLVLEFISENNLFETNHPTICLKFPPAWNKISQAYDKDPSTQRVQWGPFEDGSDSERVGKIQFDKSGNISKNWNTIKAEFYNCSDHTSVASKYQAVDIGEFRSEKFSVLQLPGGNVVASTTYIATISGQGELTVTVKPDGKIAWICFRFESDPHPKLKDVSQVWRKYSKLEEITLSSQGKFVQARFEYNLLSPPRSSSPSSPNPESGNSPVFRQAKFSPGHRSFTSSKESKKPSQMAHPILVRSDDMCYGNVGFGKLDGPRDNETDDDDDDDMPDLIANAADISETKVIPSHFDAMESLIHSTKSYIPDEHKARALNNIEENFPDEKSYDEFINLLESPIESLSVSSDSDSYKSAGFKLVNPFHKKSMQEKSDDEVRIKRNIEVKKRLIHEQNRRVIAYINNDETIPDTFTPYDGALWARGMRSLIKTSEKSKELNDPSLDLLFGDLTHADSPHYKKAGERMCRPVSSKVYYLPGVTHDETHPVYFKKRIPTSEEIFAHGNASLKGVKSWMQNKYTDLKQSVKKTMPKTSSSSSSSSPSSTSTPTPVKSKKSSQTMSPSLSSSSSPAQGLGGFKTVGTIMEDEHGGKYHVFKAGSSKHTSSNSPKTTKVYPDLSEMAPIMVDLPVPMYLPSKSVLTHLDSFYDGIKLALSRQNDPYVKDSPIPILQKPSKKKMQEILTTILSYIETDEGNTNSLDRYLRGLPAKEVLSIRQFMMHLKLKYVNGKNVVGAQDGDIDVTQLINWLSNDLKRRAQDPNDSTIDQTILNQDANEFAHGAGAYARIKKRMSQAFSFGHPRQTSPFAKSAKFDDSMSPLKFENDSRDADILLPPINDEYWGVREDGIFKSSWDAQELIVRIIQNPNRATMGELKIAYMLVFMAGDYSSDLLVNATRLLLDMRISVGILDNLYRSNFLYRVSERFGDSIARRAMWFDENMQSESNSFFLKTARHILRRNIADDMRVIIFVPPNDQFEKVVRRLSGYYGSGSVYNIELKKIVLDHVAILSAYNTQRIEQIGNTAHLNSMRSNASFGRSSDSFVRGAPSGWAESYDSSVNNLRLMSGNTIDPRLINPINIVSESPGSVPEAIMELQRKLGSFFEEKKHIYYVAIKKHIKMAGSGSRSSLTLL